MSKRKSILMTILGTMITGLAIGVFLTPNKIVGGGASGISTILFHTIGIQPGISFYIINIILNLIKMMKTIILFVQCSIIMSSISFLQVI